MSFSDGERIRHSVVVTAATLYEAVALGVRTFREQGLLTACNPASRTEISVEVRVPAVRHTVSLARLEQWIQDPGRGPKEQLAKKRVRDLLAGR